MIRINKERIISEFIEFLKNNKAFNNFMNALKMKKVSEIADLVHTTDYSNITCLIDNYFTWFETPQGTSYWSKLNFAWINHFKALNEKIEIEIKSKEKYFKYIW